MRRALIRILAGAALLVAGASAGYYVSSSLGQELLRRETERQLTRLMRGPVQIDSCRLWIRFGLRLEVRNVRAYGAPSGPGLVARRADAHIDPLALLAGRVRLRRLRLDDLVARIERRADGGLSPEVLEHDHPHGARDGSETGGHGDSPLRLLEDLGAVGRLLLERAVVAGRVEVRDAVVEYTDRQPRGPLAPPIRLRLESVRASWDHRWWSEEPEVSLRGVLVDERARRTPVEMEGRRHPDGTLGLHLAVNGLPSEILNDYAAAADPDAALRGPLSGVVAFETGEVGHGLLEVDWLVDDAHLSLPWRGQALALEGGTARFAAKLRWQPARLRLEETRLEAGGVGLALSGHLERPLRDSSRLRLRADVEGLRHTGVAAFLESLPPSDREAAERIFAPVVEGRVTHLRASGRGRLSLWRRLLRAEVPSLPRGFLLSAEVEDLVLAAGRDDRIDGARGSLEWSHRGLAVRGLEGRWNGDRLPVLDLELSGVETLLAVPRDSQVLSGEAPPLGGVAAVSRWLDGLSEDEDEAASLPDMEVHLEEVRNPLLLWPVREATLAVQRLPESLQVSVRRARWGGILVQGEVLFVPGEPSRASVVLEASDPGAPAAAAGEPDADGPWLRGQLRMGAYRDGDLAVRGLEGSLSATGSRVSLESARVDLEPEGRLEGNLHLDLRNPDRAGLDLSVQLVKADLQAMAPLLGLPGGLVTGTLHGSGALRGELVPDLPPLAKLSGQLSITGRNGEIRQRLPVIAAVARATEGFNPFSSRDRIEYEKIRSLLRLDDGVLSTDDFRLEGPVRVFASGRVDLSRPDPTIDAVVGVFLLRQADLALGNLPLVGWLVSDKGLVGAYFGATGRLDDPAVRTLPVKTMAEHIPDLVKAPFRVLSFLLSAGGRDPDDPAAPPAQRLGPRGQGIRQAPGQRSNGGSP